MSKTGENFYFNGIPISKWAIKSWCIIMAIWTIISYSILAHMGFFQLFTALFTSEIITLDESQVKIIQFTIITMIIHGSLILWLLGHTECFRLTKVLFKIQRVSLLHMVRSKKIIPMSDVFLLKNQTEWYEVMFVMFVGMWSVSLFLNRFLHPLLLLPNSIDTAWVFLTDTALLSILSYMIIVPITVLYSSNIRINIKQKNTIVTGHSLYQKVIISFASINIFIEILPNLEIPQYLSSLNYVYFAPPILLTCFFMIFSNRTLTTEFRNMLKKCGAIENDSKRKT